MMSLTDDFTFTGHDLHQNAIFQAWLKAKKVRLRRVFIFAEFPDFLFAYTQSQRVSKPEYNPED
jgi:hypothetical protein